MSLNDIDLANWRAYGHLKTDTLWLMDREDKRPPSHFHGANIPNVQRQLYERYTHAGDLVLDLFLGSGTSAVVADDMDRRCVGVDINPTAPGLRLDYPGFLAYCADAADLQTYLTINQGIRAVFERDCTDFVFLHPPYYNTIAFSGQPGDLSGEKTPDAFLTRLATIAGRATDLLKVGGWLALLMGDVYHKGRFYPISYMGYAAVLEASDGRLVPKGMVIKDIRHNRMSSYNLRRYRHLQHGTFEFKHESIFMFRREK